MQLCSAQLPNLAVVTLDTLKLSGIFPMEVQSLINRQQNTTEQETALAIENELVLGQSCSTATLGVHHQGSSAVT